MNQQGAWCDLQLACAFLNCPCSSVNVHSDKGKNAHLVQKINVLYQNQIDWSAIDIPHYVCENCIKELQRIFGDDDDDDADDDNDDDLLNSIHLKQPKAESSSSKNVEIDDYKDTDDSDVDSVDYDNYDYDSDEILQEIADDYENAVMNINLNVLVTDAERGSMTKG